MSKVWAGKSAKVCAAVMGILAAGVVQAGVLSGLGSLFGGSGQEIAEWLEDPAQPLKWGEWEYVQLVASEGRELNEHPAVVGAEPLAEVLSRVKVSVSGDKRRLFTDDEVKRLAQVASGALARAKPSQDLVFRSADRHQELGLIGQKLVNAGRIFVADGRLNIIIGTQHSEALLGLRPGMRPKQAMEPGSRAKVSPQVQILAGSASDERLVRSDWLSLGLKALQSGAGKSTVAARPEEAVSAEKPALQASGLSSVAKPDAVQSPTAVGGPEERLALLKRLFDRGLITENEYQQKRAAVLQGL